MARSRKKTRRAASHRSNAGTRRRRVTKHVAHRRHHRNPGMGSIGSPKTWVMGGAGALAGFVGSAAIPQMILGTGNTGMAGYAATAAAAVGLGLLSHFLLPRQMAVTAGVVAGGFGNLLAGSSATRPRSDRTCPTRAWAITWWPTGDRLGCLRG